MALKQIDIQRLDRLKSDIERLHIRFPISTITRKTGADKANVSAYISGRKPLSDNFLEKFYAAFGEELNKLSVPHTELELLKNMDNRLAAILEALNKLVGP